MSLEETRTEEARSSNLIEEILIRLTETREETIEIVLAHSIKIEGDKEEELEVDSLMKEDLLEEEERINLRGEVHAVELTDIKCAEFSQVELKAKHS